MLNKLSSKRADIVQNKIANKNQYNAEKLTHAIRLRITREQYNALKIISHKSWCSMAFVARALLPTYDDIPSDWVDEYEKNR